MIKLAVGKQFYVEKACGENMMQHKLHKPCHNVSNRTVVDIWPSSMWIHGLLLSRWFV